MQRPAVTVWRPGYGLDQRRVLLEQHLNDSAAAVLCGHVQRQEVESVAGAHSCLRAVHCAQALWAQESSHHVGGEVMRAVPAAASEVQRRIAIGVGLQTHCGTCSKQLQHCCHAVTQVLDTAAPRSLPVVPLAAHGVMHRRPANGISVVYAVCVGEQEQLDCLVVAAGSSSEQGGHSEKICRLDGRRVTTEDERNGLRVTAALGGDVECRVVVAIGV